MESIGAMCAHLHIYTLSLHKPAKDVDYWVISPGSCRFFATPASRVALLLSRRDWFYAR